MNKSFTKKELREEVKKVLSQLRSRWVKTASRRVCKHILNLTQSLEKEIQIKNILAWVSFFPGEVELQWFIAETLGKKEIFLPRSALDGTMTFVNIGTQWNRMNDRGVGGIPQPAENAGELFDLTEGNSSLVLVPALAFDCKGNRLGRGKGYYDRFLSSFQKEEKPITVGVGWELQIFENIPTAKHDVPVDWICTENRIINCTK
ncbi:MAG: 5-formyltetrahydrofolate cyclo-ligase [Candidatus Dadabacteria bacterium]|nr:MAG: 5-formyltetrahydrofolate cyclo-ligase [Candidatus Dadabacteria bacterium]